MKLRGRRLVAVLGALVMVAVWVFVNPESYERIFTKVENTGAEEESGDFEDGALATEILERLEVKGRAPKTGYSREEFYNGWPTVEGCSLRQRILKRDFGETAVLEECTVVAGEFTEPYTGEYMVFSSREEVSELQIDHVVALSDAWQKGAQNLTKEERYSIATDPLNLLAVDGAANMQKSDGDAATWLPPNKKFRCQYVSRQVSVKYKYGLWVSEAEKEAISRVLSACPHQRAYN
ncbi:MAG: HNH endonuclease family protein [Candidatus Saccharibacteria bacterium]|nr:HNH endonuclease family protein [Candidatus Saccharibacteria bacterium]